MCAGWLTTTSRYGKFVFRKEGETMDNRNTAERKNRRRTLDLTYIAIGAALISVCSWISIPSAVPFTLQTFAVFSVLLLLGGKRGTLSVVIYILLGAIGLPVFSNFTGGAGVLLGNTGGSILGFIFMGLIFLLFEKISSADLFAKKAVLAIVSLLLGLIVCYSFGTAWFMYVYMKNTGTVGLSAVLSWCVFPFIVQDLLKLLLALLLSKRVRPILK